MEGKDYYYFKCTSKRRLDKAINSLLGIVEGIGIDHILNAKELAYLNDWIYEHREFTKRHPFDTLCPEIQAAIADGILTQEERENIRWLCSKLRSPEYLDAVTTGLQRLHTIVGAIAADGLILEGELRGLHEWLQSHEYLQSCWPYDEIDSVITSILSDGKIDQNEHEFLLHFFSEFTEVYDIKTIANPPIMEGINIKGLCAFCPKIKFRQKAFCFTGESYKMPRKQLQETVIKLGGEIKTNVSAQVDYLIIGAEGNPCWAFACYGRKVEAAVALRKEGHRLLLVHENDFHDAVADA